MTAEKLAEHKARVERWRVSMSGHHEDIPALVAGLERECDEARAALAPLQAESAAMRVALERMAHAMLTDPTGESAPEVVEALQTAMSADAGRAYAARMTALEAVVTLVRDSQCCDKNMRQSEEMADALAALDKVKP